MQNWGFWAVAAALAAIVAVLLLQALRRGNAASDNAAALRVYRDQLAEVDRDLARGVLAEAEAERLKTEVSRRLLDADRALQAAPANRGGALIVPGLLIVLAIAGSVLVYRQLGAPGYPDLPLAERLAAAEAAYRSRPGQEKAEAAAPPAETNVTADAEFLDLIEKLRAAVAQRPDDQQGLALLARNEAQLGNYVAARKAWQHLVDLKGDQATVADHVGLAEMMIVAAGGYVSPEAEAELIRALQLDPAQPLARYYSGLMFAQNGRPDRTFALWEPLLREGPPDAPWIAPISAELPAIAEAAGIKYQPAPPPAMGKGPSAEDVAAAGEMSAEDRQAMIAGMVGQLESRLMAEGGAPEDWAKLINALGVLGETDRAKAALAAATTAYQADSAAMASITAAATAAGIAP